MPNEVSANQVLANEVLAPLPEVALSEPDYRAFCAALEASVRGRAFLAEYARRNRHADTETVLAALDRLEALVRSQAATTEADRIRQELRALLAVLRAAQPTIDASAAAIKAAKLAAMIGFVQHRIESIVANAPSPLPAEVAALVFPEEPTAEARSYLAVVPRAEEPELPIPAPAAAPPPALVQVHASAQPAQQVTSPTPAQEVMQRSAAIIPEVNLFDGAVAKAAVAAPEPLGDVASAHAPLIPAHSPPRSQSGFALAEQGAGIQDSAQIEPAVVAEIAATPVLAVFELTLPPPAVKRPASTSADPLALIMALSEAERIALFT